METNTTQNPPPPGSIAGITQLVVDNLGAATTARMLGVDKSTIYRWRSGQKLPSQARTESALRAAHQACVILSDLPEGQVRSWFLTPNRTLGYQTPQDLLASNGPGVLTAAEVAAREAHASPGTGAAS